MCKLSSYLDALRQLPFDLEKIGHLAETLRGAWQDNRRVFLCGNGGSAANAIHIANDFFYGIAANFEGHGIRAHALPANQAIVSCLANDESYADIFSDQLRVFAQPGDVLIALSGSGNSPNIVKALERAREMGLPTFAILGYSGGKCLELADTAICFRIDDMQIAEDAQLIVGHMIMQWLRENPPREKPLS
ncbi:MAG: SIS domain-containing protein [Syntrophobacteraceae bacterium]